MIIFQKFIYRADLRANPNILYLFGDNLERRGLGGQAKEMRGEDNAIGVATKKAPGMAETDFFADDAFDSNAESIRLDLRRARNHLTNGGLVVIPLDGLGTGLSELPTRAPKTNASLEAQLASLAQVAVAQWRDPFDGGNAR